MTIDWWTLGIQTVNIVILVWLLQRFFWRPVALMIEQRRAGTATTLADAAAQTEQAKAALAEIDRTRAGFARERDAILLAAHASAEAASAATLAKAATNAAALDAAGRETIRKEGEAAADAWTERAGHLAVDIARQGPIAAQTREPIEVPAPAIIDRDLVTQPVQTGLLIIDALFALGRGQRELIVGDRAIGKTTIAIDTIINQKASDIVSVYIAVGQKSSSVKRAIEAIHGKGAAERCIIIVAAAASSPGLQWIAPFAGFTMAEYFRDRGGHALVVIDDLTKHAATHREIALLTRQSPGREAYPGDVFYVHARLLERAAKLSKEKGGGSLTALPIAETDAGNLSAYIPTNLISITDGQIVLDAKLFAQGQKPAVDVGTSVSRVGGKTQARALRDAAETLRLDYAQFLELEAFTRFGGMPEGRVRKQLARGARIRAILAQPQHAPLALVEEVGLARALQSGLLDNLAPEALTAFRAGLHEALARDTPDALKMIAATGILDETSLRAFQAALQRHAQAVAAPSPPDPAPAA